MQTKEVHIDSIGSSFKQISWKLYERGYYRKDNLKVHQLDQQSLRVNNCTLPHHVCTHCIPLTHIIKETHCSSVVANHAGLCTPSYIIVMHAATKSNSGNRNLPCLDNKDKFHHYIVLFHSPQFHPRLWTSSYRCLCLILSS